MKLDEDKNIGKLKSPSQGSSFDGSEPHLQLSDLKFLRAEVLLNPLHIELTFENVKRGQIEPEEDSGWNQRLLRQYADEMNADLVGKNWYDILGWDFQFHDKTFTNRG